MLKKKKTKKNRLEFESAKEKEIVEYLNNSNPRLEIGGPSLNVSESDLEKL